MTALRLDLAAYAYYCATLQDILTRQLDAEQITTATTTLSPGSFDALAAARQAFTVDPHLAGQAGSRLPTLRPNHRKTGQAGPGPEPLSTVSLPTRRG